MDTATIWVPLAVAAVSAGPAYIAFLVRKVHEQVNGQDEKLSKMTFDTWKTIGRIEDKVDRVETKVDRHLSDHAGDGR